MLVSKQEDIINVNLVLVLSFAYNNSLDLQVSGRGPA